MTPKERVRAALAGEPTDRVPFHATFVPEFAHRLAKELAVGLEDGYDPHHGRWRGYELDIAAGIDILQAGAGWVTNYYLYDEPYTDEWGVEWTVDQYRTPFGDGSYTAIKRGPLEDGGISSYHAPDPLLPERYEHVERLISEHGKEYFTCGRVHTTIFESAWALRGMGNLMIDLLTDEDNANAVLETTYQFHRAVCRELAGLGVDMIWLGDDMGSQDSMLMSPEMWRFYFKERMATIIREVKEVQPEIVVAYHTDGSNFPILDDLVEIGLDALNPIQPESMDRATVAEKYEEKLGFFGVIDVQEVLPSGSPEDVAEEFQSARATLGRNGRWICAPTHHVQIDTPMKNFLELRKQATGLS